MKLYAKIKNDKGRQEGLGGNEYLDIDIMVGNQMLIGISVLKAKDGWKAYAGRDEVEREIAFLADKKKGQTTNGEI